MPKYARSGMSKGKKVLLILGIIILLILLFLASFWITSYNLKSNQEPDAIENVQATPKPSYKELEQMVIEKEQKIADLESELDSYKKATAKPTTAATAKPTTKASQTQTPKQAVSTPKPTARPTAKPTVVPTPETTTKPVTVPTKEAAKEAGAGSSTTAE